METNKVIFKFIKIAFSIMMALVILYATLSASMYVYDFGYRVFTEKAIDEKPGKNVRVTIASDMDGKEIGQVLEDKGVVRDGNLFHLQLKLSIYDGKLNAGDYILNTSMTAKEMMVVMATESTGE